MWSIHTVVSNSPFSFKTFQNEYFIINGMLRPNFIFFIIYTYFSNYIVKEVDTNKSSS
jgi:hypothetical protein